MGVEGFRLDIFVIIWFISIGMVNYLQTETGLFAYDNPGKYSINDMAAWNGIAVGSENTTVSDFAEPRAQPLTSDTSYYDSFLYVYKTLGFITGVIWNATLGFHTYLRDSFGIAYLPWGLPIMIIINLMNILGLVELWTKIKV